MINGLASIEHSGGTLHSHAAGDLTYELSGTDISIEVDWQEGILPSTYPEPVGFNARVENGTTTYTASAAQFRPGPVSEGGQVLAFSETAEVVASGDTGVSEATVVENQTIARHWYNEEASTYDLNGFWYHIDGPWTGLTGLDQGRVTGNFTVFVNNVTIDAVAADGTSYSDWAGFRVQDPDTPAGPASNPAAKEYEVRVALVKVTNGTLWVNATDAVEVYGPDSTLKVDGTVTSSSVSGRLLAAPYTYRYDGDPLELNGVGNISLAPTRAAGATGTRADAPAALSVQPRGAFTVEAGDGVEISSASSAPSPFSVPFLEGLDWKDALLSVLGVSGLALAAVALSAPSRARAVAERGLVAWRKNRYEHWIRQARDAFDDHDYARSASWYERAVRAFPGKRIAWHGLLLAYLEGGFYDEGLAALDRAQDTLGLLDPDFIELGAVLALGAGERERAVELVLVLAEYSPDMTRVLLDDPGMNPLRKHDEIAQLLKQLGRPGDAEPDPGDLQGYV